MLELLNFVPTALKAGYLLFNKPKKSDFENKLLESAYERTIANNRADIVGKTLYNQTTRAAKSLGSRLYQQSQRAIDVSRNTGMLSEGQHASALLQTGAGIQQQVGEQQQQALLQNTQYTSELQNESDKYRHELALLKDQARREYKAATQQWTAELFGTGMDLAATAANTIQAGLADKKQNDFLKRAVTQLGLSEEGAINDPAKLDQMLTYAVLFNMGLDLTANTEEVSNSGSPSMMGMGAVPGLLSRVIKPKTDPNASDEPQPKFVSDDFGGAPILNNSAAQEFVKASQKQNQPQETLRPAGSAAAQTIAPPAQTEVAPQMPVRIKAAGGVPVEMVPQEITVQNTPVSTLNGVQVKINKGVVMVGYNGTWYRLKTADNKDLSVVPGTKIRITPDGYVEVVK